MQKNINLFIHNSLAFQNICEKLEKTGVFSSVYLSLPYHDIKQILPAYIRAIVKIYNLVNFDWSVSLGYASLNGFFFFIISCLQWSHGMKINQVISWYKTNIDYLCLWNSKNISLCQIWNVLFHSALPREIENSKFYIPRLMVHPDCVVSAFAILIYCQSLTTQGCP